MVFAVVCDISRTSVRCAQMAKYSLYEHERECVCVRARSQSENADMQQR